VIASGGLSLIDCERAQDGGQPPEPEPVLLGPESLAPVRRERLNVGPRVSGSLQARRQSAIRAETAGSIVALEAELGDVVERGQVLARIEARALRDAVVSAESGVRSAEQGLTLAERERERTARLAQAGALPRRDLDAADNALAGARAALEDARARLALARQDLSASVVRAPMAGVISAQPAHAGDVVTPGTELFTIIDPSSMRLAATVPSSELPRLAVGTAVAFRVRGYPEETFEGTIESIAPAADPATRQIAILVAIPNPGERLLAGLFAEGHVRVLQKEALVVPRSALDLEAPRPNVSVVRGGRLAQISVTIGIRDEERELVEVAGSLSPGELVVTGAARSLGSGTPVKIVHPPGADAGSPAPPD